MRRTARLAFLIIHVAGGLYSLVALQKALALRLLLKLVVERWAFFGIAPSWLFIPFGLVGSIILSVIETRRTLQRRRRGEPEPDVALRLRVLVYVAVGCIWFTAFVLSTPETFAGPFRLRFAVQGPITASFAYGAYALWSILLPRLRTRFSERFRRNLDLIGMNVVLALVLAEVSLRILAAFWSSPILVTESSSSKLRRDSERQAPGALHHRLEVRGIQGVELGVLLSIRSPPRALELAEHGVC